MIDLKKRLILSTVVSSSNKKRITVEKIADNLGISSSYVHEFLSSFKNIVIDKNVVYIIDKSGLVIEAWLKGFNITDIALRSGWRDLERLCSVLFRKFGYATYMNFRFKWCNERREIDVLALKVPNIFLCDCKLWRRARVSQLKEAIEKQRERALLFSKAIKGSNFLVDIAKGWKYAEVYPIIITVLEVPLKVYKGIAVVSLSSLRSFLIEFDSYRDILDCYFINLY
ncbi:MAG: hypothetical protein DRJ64_05955 [Thermoprotei archaeon]|nr:MAG: hypothetical protein DRJ64_05955 [Thermoprotei archaeon]